MVSIELITQNKSFIYFLKKGEKKLFDELGRSKWMTKPKIRWK